MALAGSPARSSVVPNRQSVKLGFNAMAFSNSATDCSLPAARRTISSNTVNPEVEQLLDRQSQEAGKRRALVWEIERRLAEDVANPVILHAVGYGCWQPHVKGYVLQQNTIYNHWRLEDVWLDR